MPVPAGRSVCSPNLLTSGTQANCTVNGGDGPYTWSIPDNESTGSIDPVSGVYTAGPNGMVIDYVQVVDFDGTYTAVPITVASFTPVQIGTDTDWKTVSVGQFNYDLNQGERRVRLEDGRHDLVLGSERKRRGRQWKHERGERPHSGRRRVELDLRHEWPCTGMRRPVGRLGLVLGLQRRRRTRQRRQLELDHPTADHGLSGRRGHVRCLPG